MTVLVVVAAVVILAVVVYAATGVVPVAIVLGFTYFLLLLSLCFSFCGSCCN